MKQNKWITVGAVAAMMATGCIGAFAQTTPDTSTGGTGTGTAPAPAASAPSGGSSSSTMPGSTDTSGNMSTGSGGGSSMGMSGAVDYSVLLHPQYDYIELMQAKARGLSNREVATIARISRESDTPFDIVTQQVLAGQNFASLATRYGLKLKDVQDVSDEEQKIATYEATYQTTGMNSGMMGGMSTTPTGMSSTMPATTPVSTTPAMPTMDIVQVAMAHKNLSTLVKALQSAGLVDTLKGPGPFTVFAPDNKAFKKLPKGALKSLMANTDQLKSILTYHVIPARVDAAAAMSMTSPTSPPTVQGGTLQVTTSDGKVMLNGTATVVTADIQASNGIIHIIDTVLMPPGSDASGGTMPATTPAAPAPAMPPAAPAPAPATPAP